MLAHGRDGWTRLANGDPKDNVAAVSLQAKGLIEIRASLALADVFYVRVAADKAPDVRNWIARSALVGSGAAGDLQRESTSQQEQDVNIIPR